MNWRSLAWAVNDRVRANCAYFFREEVVFRLADFRAAVFLRPLTEPGFLPRFGARESFKSSCRCFAQ